MKCCFCKREFYGMGNNPAPIINDRKSRCCNDCNEMVIRYRMIEFISAKENRSIEKNPGLVGE